MSTRQQKRLFPTVLAITSLVILITQRVFAKNTPADTNCTKSSFSRCFLSWKDQIEKFKNTTSTTDKIELARNQALTILNNSITSLENMSKNDDEFYSMLRRYNLPIKPVLRIHLNEIRELVKKSHIYTYSDCWGEAGITKSSYPYASNTRVYVCTDYFSTQAKTLWDVSSTIIHEFHHASMMITDRHSMDSELLATQIESIVMVLGGSRPIPSAYMIGSYEGFIRELLNYRYSNLKNINNELIGREIKFSANLLKRIVSIENEKGFEIWNFPLSPFKNVLSHDYYFSCSIKGLSEADKIGRNDSIFKIVSVELTPNNRIKMDLNSKNKLISDIEITCSSLYGGTLYLEHLEDAIKYSAGG